MSTKRERNEVVGRVGGLSEYVNAKNILVASHNIVLDIPETAHKITLIATQHFLASRNILP